jgi:2,5-furandicarboxylate decarboxylase 1
MSIELPKIIDTRFRSALQRLSNAGRIESVSGTVSHEYEVASLLKKRDGSKALLFPDVQGFEMPVFGNFLCSQANCEAAFGTDFRGIRQLVGRAIANPLEPRIKQTAPWQENVYTKDFDIGKILPVLRHAESDPGRFITAGVVVFRDPETGIYNASYHRLQLLGANKTALKMDYGRHLRLAYERAAARGEDLPISVCIGTDLSVLYTAATMGSQMPENADELKVAGGLIGEGLPVCKGITQDILIPAETEIVLEGLLRHNVFAHEGPFGEFIGYMSEEGDAPIFDVTSVAHRNNAVYYAINGFGRETVMLRKYVLEASLLRVLQAATPIVDDVDMTAGGLHRFHAVLSLNKTTEKHDGLQYNAMMASFGALKDLDMVIAVDNDIDIHDPHDVEYALATRMEASKDLVVIPGARGHEYVRIGKDGIRAKLAIDATVPFNQKARFTRVKFMPSNIDESRLEADATQHISWLE